MGLQRIQKQKAVTVRKLEIFTRVITLLARSFPKSPAVDESRAPVLTRAQIQSQVFVLNGPQKRATGPP